MIANHGEAKRGRDAAAALRTTVRLRSETMVVQPFAAVERAALPRLDRSGVIQPFFYTGVPEKLRATINRNLHHIAFPYPRWLRSDGSLEPQIMSLVEIDAERFRCVMAAGLGGRILSIFDKDLGQELLWTPPALRQEAFGHAGAFLSAGIEFNACRFGHSVHGQFAPRIETVRMSSGHSGVRFGFFDELFACSWEATLLPLADAVAIRIRFVNHSAQPQPGYWWTNIAIPGHGHTRLLMPPGPMLHHGARPGFQHEAWPSLHGRDGSWQRNHDDGLSAYLYELSSGYMGYADVQRGMALAHHADPSILRGRKLWSIGTGAFRTAWWQRLAEPAMPSYYEIQAGRCPTQLQSDLLAPHSVLEWTELFTGLELDASGDYPEVFDRFTARAQAAFSRSRPWEAPEAWQVDTSHVLVEASPRAEISRRIVLAPESVSEEEANAWAGRGWLGGVAWIGRLKTLAAQSRLNRMGQLALAAALLDQGQEDEAVAQLSALADDGDVAAAWACWLLGHHAVAKERLTDAARRWTRATVLLPAEPEIRAALVGLLLRLKRPGEANQILDRCPEPLALTEPIRQVRAQAAFDAGRWEAVRAALAAPLKALDESSAASWELRKEADLGEALEKFARGWHGAAQVLLSQACEEMPQFGVGRNEAAGNADLFFYRWVLARQAGDSFTAQLLAAQLLAKDPYPENPDAAYIWRLAAAIGDRSAPRRRATIDHWELQAGAASLEKFAPLWMAVVRRTRGIPADIAWSSLRDDRLYKYRAGFESTLDCLGGSERINGDDGHDGAKRGRG